MISIDHPGDCSNRRHISYHPTPRKDMMVFWTDDNQKEKMLTEIMGDLRPVPYKRILFLGSGKTACDLTVTYIEHRTGTELRPQTNTVQTT